MLVVRRTYSVEDLNANLNYLCPHSCFWGVKHSRSGRLRTSRSADATPSPQRSPTKLKWSGSYVRTGKRQLVLSFPQRLPEHFSSRQRRLDDSFTQRLGDGGGAEKVFTAEGALPSDA